MKMERSKGNVRVMVDEVGRESQRLGYMWKELQPRKKKICLSGQRGSGLRNNV